jgi:hypothetical protein
MIPTYCDDVDGHLLSEHNKVTHAPLTMMTMWRVDSFSVTSGILTAYLQVDLVKICPLALQSPIVNAV